MRKLLPFVLFGACLAGLNAPTEAEEGNSPTAAKTFGGWTGTCNNIGACVAIGTSDAEGFFYVRIGRGAGAAASPQVKLVLVTQDPLKGTSPAFELRPKGARTNNPLGPFPAATDTDDASQFTTTVEPPDASLAVIDAIRNADTLDYELLGAKGTLDLKGLSATLRWIDAQQGREGTPTALVAKGMTPIGQVPEPREPPGIVAAPAGSVSDIPKPVLSKPLLDAATALADCDKDTVQTHEEAAAWRFGPDLILFSVPCTNGAYNFLTALFFTDANGNAPRPVPLPNPAGGDEGVAANIVTNMNFDPSTMTLSEFAKGRGIGDCGETREWVWTGKAFAMLDASRLDVCAGALSEDWPNTYTAIRK